MTKNEAFEYKEIWSFATQYDDHTYEVKWANLTRIDGSYTEPYLFVEKDGQQLSDKQERKSVAAQSAIQAAIAFRVAELHAEYTIPAGTDIERWEKAKDAIESLASRAIDDEYVGQQSSMGLYTQDVANILGIPEYQIIQLTRELIAEKRIGLNGLIYTSFDRYNSARQYWENKTGHKNFDRSDMGSWWCNYCGVRGDVQDTLQPKDIECIEGKYESE